MSLPFRKIAPGIRNYPLKQKKSAISAVISNDWFPNYMAPNNLKIQFRGTRKQFNVIRNLKPTLNNYQVYRIDYSARYAVMMTGGDYVGIVTRFLENSDRIWDFGDRGSQWQNETQTLPVTASDQPVNLVKPLTGTNYFTTLSPFTAPKSSSDGGLLFLTTPNSNYKLVTGQNVKTVIACHNPTDISNYVFMLSDWNGSSHDFCSGYNTTYFDTTYTSLTILNGDVKINNSVVDPRTLLRVNSKHIISIASKDNTTLYFNSIANDRYQHVLDATGTTRNYVGSYYLLFTSDKTYTELQLSELNVFCQMYAGMI